MIKCYNVQVFRYSPNGATFAIYSCCYKATKRPCDYENLFPGKRKSEEQISQGMTVQMCYLPIYNFTTTSTDTAMTA